MLYTKKKWDELLLVAQVHSALKVSNFLNQTYKQIR